MPINDLQQLLKLGADAEPDSLDTLAGLLRASSTRAEVLAEGAASAPALAALLPHKDKTTRKLAAEALTDLGPAARGVAPAIAKLATNKDAATRKLALAAAATVGGDATTWAEAAEFALRAGDKAVIDLFAHFDGRALPILRAAWHRSSPKSQLVIGECLKVIAPHIDAVEVEDLLRSFLLHDKEPQQRLGLELIARIRKPPLSLAEEVADLSSLPGARTALLRFPEARVKRELRSLIKSQSPPERTVGFEVVKHYGSSAREFAPLIAEVLANDTHAESARTAVHTLARLLPDDELAAALEPALDHWDADVQKVARRYLAQAEVAPRASVWDNHPFSPGLLRQLQRLGFKPTAPFAIPPSRPLPDRPFEWNDPGDLVAHTLSPAVWALLHALTSPPYTLYTVWGSYENRDTFYFSKENPIYVLPLRERTHLMHVIGDGSIGYFATIDLLDTSNDPAVYYIERWGGWGDGGWQASWNLSGYLRNLGTR